MKEGRIIAEDAYEKGKEMIIINREYVDLLAEVLCDTVTQFVKLRSPQMNYAEVKFALLATVEWIQEMHREEEEEDELEDRSVFTVRDHFGRIRGVLSMSEEEG